MSISKNDDPLRTFYERRHPEYHRLAPVWRFLQATYDGGRAWFADNIFKFHKEGQQEFNDRLNRAYRFNHTRETVDLVQKYLFKAPVSRSEDAPQVVKDFWENSTLSNLNIDSLMRMSTASNSVKGRAAIFVDNNMREGGMTIAEARAAGIRIYAYLITATDLLDYAWDEEGDGGLLWVKVREFVRDDKDPIASCGDIIERVRLWTRKEWILFEEVESEVDPLKRSKKKQKVIREIDRGEHNLDVVPCVFVDHNVGDAPYAVPGLIDDIGYLDRAVANYLSNLDAIIQDQTFSQLAMPAQAVMPGDDEYDAVLSMGTKRVFLFDGAGGKPEYLSPDPKQAQIILTVIEKIINEIYHTVGLAGERTKQDNAVGIDNSSGVAKAYDFERVNSLLLSKAQSCENAENKLVQLVCKWANIAIPTDKLVQYPLTFDVMRLADELSVGEALGKLAAPNEVRREQMRQIVDKLFPRLKKDLREAMEKDIKTWLEGEDLVLNPPSSFGSKPATSRSRQGSVTAKTPTK
ncbi:phage portal protein [Phyllobacterium myrsinacearum]|uniref:Phage portal protein n=1 Tax=Phyllobacterium myrsinacearum TaxID=28101 RepID=A0A839EU62_9HYPH|nr:phage portal protein [Phyllobacterium myrsinacearum]MBA8881718.1 hypothetical protein [Phyllobacterium myrsinacearum]